MGLSTVQGMHVPDKRSQGFWRDPDHSNHVYWYQETSEIWLFELAMMPARITDKAGIGRIAG